MSKLGDIPISLLKTKVGGSGDKAVLLTFLCDLEGYKIKFKNLHWSAPSDAVHKRVDDILDSIIEFQDEVAEVTQGIYGVFGPNELAATHMQFDTSIQALQSLIDKVNYFHEKVSGKKELIGVTASVEGFMTQLRKYMYLLKIALGG